MRSTAIFNFAWLLSFAMCSSYEQSKSFSPDSKKRKIEFHGTYTKSIDRNSINSKDYLSASTSQQQQLAANNLIDPFIEDLDFDFSFKEYFDLPDLINGPSSDGNDPPVIIPSGNNNEPPVISASGYGNQSSVLNHPLSATIPTVPFDELKQKQPQDSSDNGNMSESVVDLSDYDWNPFLTDFNLYALGIQPNNNNNNNNNNNEPVREQERQDSPMNWGLFDFDLLLGNYPIKHDPQTVFNSHDLDIQPSNNQKQEMLITNQAIYQQKIVDQQFITPLSNPQITGSGNELNPNTCNNLPYIVLPNYSISHQKEDIESIGFKFQFDFYLPKKFNFYFGTNDLRIFFIFLYSRGAFTLLFDKNQNNALEQSYYDVSNGLDAILSTVSSLNSTVRPFFYLFDANNTQKYHTNNHRRLPLYFLFTSISYLMQNDEFEGKNSLVDLVKRTFRMRQGGIFSSDNWNFLRDHLVNNFQYSHDETETTQIKNPLYDISTVSFIYSEMRFGKDDRVRQFFKQVWNACQIDYNKRLNVQICINPSINITVNTGFKMNSYEYSARKFYQMKFIELLANEWETLDDLLGEYGKLRKYFSSIPYDFRLRMLNLVDFESLDKSLERIDLLLVMFSLDDKRKEEVRNFFTELKCFIHFKCIFFTREFFLQIEKIRNTEIYKASFITIKSIYNNFNKIDEKLNGNEIILGEIDYKIINLNEPFLFQQVIDHLLIESFDLKTIQDNFNFIYSHSYLSPSNYLDDNLSKLPLLTKFELNEYLVEFKKYLDNNDETNINEIFINEKYKEIRQFGFEEYEKYSNPDKQIVQGQYEFSFEEKKFLIDQFIQFLILYNQ